MGNGLHHALVQGEGGFQQSLAVACGTGPDDLGPFRQFLFQFAHGVHGRLDGVALVSGIVGKQELSLLAHKNQLCSGGAGIDAQIAVAPVIFKGGSGHHMLPVTLLEFIKFLSVPEQGLQPRHFKGGLYAFFQGGNQLVQFKYRSILRLQGRAHGGKKVGVFRVHRGFVRQVKGPDKGLFQLRQEMQRPAQEGHAAPYGLAAGKTRNGLIHHSLENGGCQVRLGGSFVDEGLNIRLGKNAAPGGNGIDLFVFPGCLVQAFCIGLQKGGHLVNKRAGASGAHTIHPLVQAAPEIDDLGVLAAKLNGHIGLGGCELQSRGHRHDLLHKGDLQCLSQGHGAGACDFDLQIAAADFLPGIGQQLAQRFLGMGLVALIGAVKDLSLLIQNHQLYRGGTYIDTGTILPFQFSHFLGLLAALSPGRKERKIILNFSRCYQVRAVDLCNIAADRLNYGLEGILFLGRDAACNIVGKGSLFLHAEGNGFSGTVCGIEQNLFPVIGIADRFQISLSQKSSHCLGNMRF